MGKVTQKLELGEMVAANVHDGDVVALGGLHFHNTPMAAVRELIRRRIRIKRLVPPVDGSINADQLIGAGLVEEIQTPYVGLEHIGMAPRFRAAVEGGRLRVRETEEAGFVFGIQAGAAGLPFAVLPEGFFPEGSSLPTVPSVNEDDYRQLVDPFTGATHHAARAIRPDVAILHCQLIDRRGNGGYLGSGFFDSDVARASERCIVVAEREVESLPAECRGHLPGFVVDAYCVLEHGAHPAGSHRLYRFDEDHIRAYAEAARTDAGFDAYREQMIGPDEDSYRRAADVAARIDQLRSEDGG
jgi:glutaconate CoA-transferase subunit A